MSPIRTTSPRRSPPPRNAVEIPLYVLDRYGVFPPVRVLLGMPYHDLDARLHGQSPRVVRSAPPGAPMIIDDGVPRRRGPMRGPGSMQLIPDIGINVPPSAIAWMLLWRDLAIMHGQLGVQALNRDGSWRRAIESRQVAVRKQCERIRGAGGDLTPRWPWSSDETVLRNAVIAARGTARRCAPFPERRALVAAALARYPQPDIDLTAIALPVRDDYGYHPDVREIARCFRAWNAPNPLHFPEITHRVVRTPLRAAAPVGTTLFF